MGSDPEILGALISFGLIFRLIHKLGGFILNLCPIPQENFWYENYGHLLLILKQGHWISNTPHFMVNMIVGACSVY